MNIAIAADHAGFEYKEALKLHLSAQGHNLSDFGTNSLESCDYPDFVHPLAQAVESRKCIFGVLVCGSGNGVCMTANKHAGIRAAMAWENDLAALSRQHNDANVICIPARFISLDKARELVDIFISTEFEGGRHQRRVDKIPTN